MSQSEQTPLTPSEPTRRARRRRRRFIFASGLGLAALAGLFATRAWAHGFHHGRFGRPRSADELRDRLERGADFALSRVDATDDQRRRVEAILDQNAAQLFAAMERGGQFRKQLVDALTSNDPAAAESARRQGLVWADEASRLWLSTLEQSMAVLDSAQRQKIREHLARFGDRGGPADGHGPGDPHGQAGSGSAR